MKLYALLIVLFSVLLAVFGQIAMKNGMNAVGTVAVKEIFDIKKLLAIFTNKFVFFGCLLYAIALIAWLVGLSRLDVSYMYPLLSLGYVLTAIFAFIFLKENITLMRWAGIFLIFIGSYFIIRT